ncbi:unnamed protein product [Prorocentrum cordatum]|uniref:Uncharacterized protein n=1 Tax=Prorocentrum cordatum TaxID=2364126 RepID=A0ABN9VLK9_9DINO|nr:unnamed protein product [Polarella glacialis]
MGSSESSRAPRPHGAQAEVRKEETLTEETLRFCERRGIRFTHKAIYAHALPGIAGIELGQAIADILTAGLAELRRATAGNAYHWFFVARDGASENFFVTYAHDLGFACSLQFRLQDALKAGCLSESDACNVWMKHQWIEASRPRSAADMQALMRQTPSWGDCYRWDSNNCQHYAWYLYRPDYGPEECTV